MNTSSMRLRRLCVMAVLCAMAYVTVALIRIPVVLFLSYEPKDVLLVIGAFLFGPIAGGLTAIVVALLEMITISNTGIIGFAMNALSSCLFVCTAAIIYQRHKTVFGAIIGLLCGAAAATAGMLLWNYLVTPLYMTVMSRAEIAAILPTVFLPFNLLKTTLNSTLAMLLYKPIVRTLRTAKLLPTTENSQQNRHRIVPLITAFILLTLVAVMLVWSGII